MKKKKINKLSLNKDAVSNLDQLKGGNPTPAPTPPIAVGCSWNNPCSVKPSCLISFYASDCWLI